jgi:NAD(P)-dependent dehydrogenase (short-subunit alcohol dehydrogenase family)
VPPLACVSIVVRFSLQVAYTASKGAVLALTRELAVIHAKEGIRVNTLCPGPLRTELLMKVGISDGQSVLRLVL